MRHLRFALLLPAALLLSACASLLGGDHPAAVYTLDAAAPAAAGSTRAVATPLAVATPDAAGLLDSPAILVSPGGGELQVYAGARWSERPSLLLRQRLLDALGAAGASHAFPAASGALAPYTLESDLVRFQAGVGDGGARAQVVLDVRLIDSGSRQLLAQRRFHASAAATSDHAAALATAFGRAGNSVCTQAAGWALAQLPPAPTGH